MNESLEQEIKKLRSYFWSERDPDGRGFVPLADAYRRAGDLRQAKDLLVDGLKRHPTYTSAYVVSGWVSRELSDADAAVAFMNQVLSLDPENLEALRSIAEIAEDQGDHETALTHFRKAAALDTDDPELARRVESLGGVSIGVPPATTSSVPVAHEPVVWEDVAGEGVSDTDGAEELRSHERGVHEDVAGRDVAQEDVAQEEVAQEGVAQEDVGHGPVAQEEAAQEDVVYEEAALQELAEEDADQEDLSQEDLILDDDPWVAGDAGAWGADTDSGLASVDLTTWGDDESASTESEAAYGDDPDADAMSASEEADLYTRTMGELYARQGLYDQAVTVYEHLLEADPENPSFRERLAELHDLAADAPPPSVDSDAVTADDGAHTATDILADDLAASPEGLDVPTPFAWSETDEEERLPGEADRATSDYCDELLALDEEDATATADDVDAIWDIPEDGLARGDDVVMSAANPASGIEEPAIESVGPGQISDLAVVPFGFTDAEGEPASEAAAAFSEAVVDSLAPDDVIPVSVESLAPEGVTPVSVESLDRDADPSVSTESLDVAGVTAVSIESLAPDSATVISVASLAPFADAAVAIESLAPDSSTVVPIELLGPVGEVETAADSAPPAEPEVADAFAEWLNQLKP